MISRLFNVQSSILNKMRNYMKDYQELLSEVDLKDYKDVGYAQPGGRAAEGLKDDLTKPPMALLDPDYLEGVARVLGFGASKYSPNNWRGGINYSRLISAAYRHLGSINRGEDLDPESGLPHVYHLGCCNMFLAAMMKNRPELDDRWKGQ